MLILVARIGRGPQPHNHVGFMPRIPDWLYIPNGLSHEWRNRSSPHSSFYTQIAATFRAFTSAELVKTGGRLASPCGQSVGAGRAGAAEGFFPFPGVTAPPWCLSVKLCGVSWSFENRGSRSFFWRVVCVARVRPVSDLCRVMFLLASVVQCLPRLSHVCLQDSALTQCLTDTFQSCLYISKGVCSPVHI